MVKAICIGMIDNAGPSRRHLGRAVDRSIHIGLTHVFLFGHQIRRGLIIVGIGIFG